MKENKGLSIFGYILIFILLSPIIAVLLYVLLGGALLYTLVIYNRVKNGRTAPKEGKSYKIASTLVFMLAIGISFYVFSSNGWSFNLLDIKTFITCQIVAFVGFIPVVIYYLQKIKHIDKV